MARAPHRIQWQARVQVELQPGGSWEPGIGTSRETHVPDAGSHNPQEAGAARESRARGPRHPPSSPCKTLAHEPGEASSMSAPGSKAETQGPGGDPLGRLLGLWMHKVPEPLGARVVPTATWLH